MRQKVAQPRVLCSTFGLDAGSIREAASRIVFREFIARFGRGLRTLIYSQYDLADLFVRLHVSVSRDDIFESD